MRLEQVFEDSTISGGSVVGREQFELMIEMARLNERPPVDGIIYWDTKRFARNQLDSQFYKGDLRRRGYRLISLSDDIPDNEFAVVVEAFLEWKAQKDRQDIAKDVKRGMVYIVSMRDENGNYLGLFPGARPTFFKGVPYDTGLKRNDGKPRIVQRLIPDPETWEKGKQAWQMRAERASYNEIERELRLFSKNAHPTGTYSHIFKNEIYIGRLHYGGRTYENFVPPLATPKQWEAVQALNYKRGRGRTFEGGKTHPKQGRGEYLLSGLCRCLYCQSAMHAAMDRRKDRQTYWSYYWCARKKARLDCLAKKMPGKKLEEAIVVAVCDRVLTVEFVEGWLRRSMLP